MAGRRRESESAARTRYVHGGRGGKRIDSSVKSYLRKVIDKRRWMGLGTRIQ